VARLSVNALTTFRWSFEEDVYHYAQAGITTLGVWRHKLSDFGEEKGIELLADNGLSVSSLLWTGGFTGSEGRNFRESMEDARDALRLAAAMKAGCVIVYSGARAGHTHNHARRLFRNALTELAPLAEELGVALAVEPIHPGCAADCTFVTTLADTLQVLEAVNHPQVKMVYDVCHLCQEGFSLEMIAEIAPRIALVQLGDTRRLPQGESHRCRLGEGNLPLRQIIAKLQESGYRGYFEVELVGEEFESADYRDLLAHSQNAVRQLSEVVGVVRG
jgi:sugar phosphate isomerase/epimerase